MRQTTPDRNITPFDKTRIYTEQIEPIIDNLIKMCTIHNVPIFITCCTQNDEEKTTYERHSVPADAHNLNLTNDEIQKHLCLQLGFDTIYRNDVEIEFEEDGQKIT